MGFGIELLGMPVPTAPMSPPLVWYTLCLLISVVMGVIIVVCHEE
ncbi:hypothetical protein [Vulcanisaeta sp. JCM 14467]|nr:hypothetical protein [Vulcanisaeta sp. JCM 14467]